MRVSLEDTFYVIFHTNDATGALSDADSTPTAAVFEDGSASAAMGSSVANITTGEYRCTVVCTAANGYEQGKWYNVVIAATVDTIASKKTVATFQIMATPTTEGLPEVDTTHFRGEAIPALFATGIPFVAPQDGTITQAKFGAATGSGARGAFYLLGGIMWNSAPSSLTSTTVTLPAADEAGIDAPSFDDALIGATIVLSALNALAETIHNEVRYVTDYVASTRVVTLDRELANTTDVIWVTIYAGTGRAEVDVGKWRGTQPNTLTSGRVESLVGAMSSGVVTATAIATDAITSAELATSAVNEIADAVWGADPTSYTSASQMGYYVLKVLKPLLTRTATAQAGGASTITLDGFADATDDYYNGALVVIASGTGSVQFRTISDYVGATKVATVDRAWTTNPDGTSVFCIFPAPAATITSLPTSVLEAIRDKILDYPFRTGRTVRGVLRRLSAAIGGRVQNLDGSTVIFYQPDGVTEEYRVTQDPTNGNRTAEDVTNSETP